MHLDLSSHNSQSMTINFVGHILVTTHCSIFNHPHRPSTGKKTPRWLTKLSVVPIAGWVIYRIASTASITLFAFFNSFLKILSAPKYRVNPAYRQIITPGINPKYNTQVRTLHYKSRIFNSQLFWGWFPNFFSHSRLKRWLTQEYSTFENRQFRRYVFYSKELWFWIRIK